MQYEQATSARVQFDMLALTIWQIRLIRVLVPLVILLIIISPLCIIRLLLPAGWLGLAPVTLGILLSLLLWCGGGFLLPMLFHGAAMADRQQQAQLQQLFVAHPELHAYRDRVAALGRGFTVGEHATLMAWPAMKSSMEDDLDSAV